MIHIEWRDTPHRHVVTEDNVTKDECHVHAYSYAKAVLYLATLREMIQEAEYAKVRAARDAAAV